MRVAFFGGSFDPPHCGHLAIARAAQERLGLDRVLFAPVGLQPLKHKGSMASFADRVAMTRLAIADKAWCELSLVDAPEAQDGSPNYTAETLERLRAEMAGDELFLLMGADSLRMLRRWHRAKEIPFLARLIVAARPGEWLGDEASIAKCMPEGIGVQREGAADMYRLRNESGGESTLTLLPDLNYEISATDVRKAIRAREATASGTIPEAVLGYIREHALYR
jgi:nicotinate-nucleotide adenylyltransferase